VCGAPTVETGPKNKGGKFLEPPILTTLQRSNAWSPSGGVELEGAIKSTLISNLYQCNSLAQLHEYCLLHCQQMQA